MLLLGLNVTYLLIFGLAGLFGRKLKSGRSKQQKSSYLIMVPGYQEDGVIVSVANNLSKIDYPRELFDVLIIADSFQEKTIEELKEEDVQLLEVSFEKSTKAKALNKAFDSIQRTYDYAIIMDADNVVDREFLHQIESVSEKERIKALQCHRIAKNTNTNVAVLDTISEEVNNHIFRKGHVNLGLSSSLIGSGMVFNYNLISDFLKKSKAIGGFDKELELMMFKDGIRIQYLDDCYVYDEKVQEMDHLNNQRRRWLSAQIFYLKKSLPDALKTLFTKGNVDYLDKSLQMALIPRVMLLGLIPLMSGVSFLFSELSQVLSLILLGGIVLTMFISIPSNLYNKKLVKALFALPRGILGMFLTLLKLKGANKTFIHTPHSSKIDS